MSMIKNLKTDENGWFANGTFDSDSLFQGECSVSIFLDDGATVEDAEKYISHYNNLKNNNAFCEKLQKKLASFFLYMYDEWKAMGTYAEIVDTIEPVMQDYQAGKSLLAFLSNPTLCIYPQQGQDTGYGIECDCPWEPEHACLILIRNSELLYVGPSEDLDAWGDEEDYFCIWEDTQSGAEQ